MIFSKVGKKKTMIHNKKETPFHMEPQVFRTLLEVFISLGVFLVIGEILTGVLVGTVLWKDGPSPLHLKITSMTGYALGIFLAGAGFFHMAKKAGEIVDTGTGAAVTIQRKGYLFRLFIFAAAIIAGYFSGLFNVVGILVGTLLLKPAIFLQPLVHKVTGGPDYDLDAPSLPYDEEEEEDEEELNGKFSWKRMLEFDDREYPEENKGKTETAENTADAVPETEDASAKN